FIVGGAVVVFVSFLLVLPRAVGPEAAADVESSHREEAPPPASRIGASIAALVLLLLMLSGWAGSQEPGENIISTAFWLLIWVVMPISCALLGNWTATVNPFAGLARLADRDAVRRRLLGGPAVRWPDWLGWWPSVILFFVVATGELVFNALATVPRVTAWGLLAYALLSAAGGVIVGADAWLARGEIFSVLFGTWGRLGLFRFGAPGPRGFGGGLRAPFEPSVSRITFVLLLLVSVSFDGLLTTDAWRSARGHLPLGIAPGTAPYLALTTMALVVLLLVAWALFGGFAAAVRAVGRMPHSVIQVLAGLLPSLLPIALGYLIAHNAEYIAINGQLLIPLAGNPAGLGWHLLPAPFDDSYAINANILPSGVVWYLQVALIIGVHIAAVVMAHRFLGRAARTVGLARRSEAPWVIAMVAYTMTSLWLLAQPLVEEGVTAALRWSTALLRA
ncbi:MAG: hypothetical protein ABR564_10325, partial [Candidatus Dormibacteria bacterium]